MYSAVAFGQPDDGKSCSRVRLASSTVVHGYVFKTYDAINPDVDSACLRIYKHGRVVFRLTQDVESYELGQKANAEYKVPSLPNGTDVTGNGRPDMVVTSWSGGAHCCFIHYVFELEPKLRLLSAIQDGNTDLAHFEKLDQQPGYYYVTYDILSYWPASFASSVSHKVFLKWDGSRFRLDLKPMQSSAPTSQQWSSSLRDVDDALKNGGDVRGSLGVTLWDTTLDLIYTGHPDLAWKFVSEVPSDALKGDNPSLADFCSMLRKDPYWPELEPKLGDVPLECKLALNGLQKQDGMAALNAPSK
jgi:hypothetical protein